MTGIKLYQSVLRKLGNIPQIYLIDIDNYLTELLKKVEKPKSKNITDIMSFAGSWSDMEEEDFIDFLEETKNIRKNTFDRKLDL